MAGELREELDQLSEVLKPNNKIVEARLPIKVHGKWLDYTPKNASFKALVHHFNMGRPTFVRLEPGEGTRYDLVLVPLSDPTAKQISPSYGVDAQHFALLSLINVGGRKTTFVGLNNYFTSNWYNDELSNENDFTRLAVAWFVGYFSHIHGS